MAAQRYLPGFEPGYIRFDLTRRPDGFWDVSTYAVDGPGFVSAADRVSYEALALFEAADVLAAELDSLGLVDPA